MHILRTPLFDFLCDSDCFGQYHFDETSHAVSLCLLMATLAEVWTFMGSMCYN